MKTFQYSNAQILTFSLLVVVLGVWVIRAVNLDFFRYKNEANVNPQMMAILVKQGDELNNESEKLINQSNNYIAQIVESSRQNSATSMNSLWEKTDFKTGIPKIPLSNAVSEYDMVTLNPAKTNMPSIGDTFMLPLTGSQIVSAQIESISINPNGDYTWRGHLAGFGNQYPVTMTYGENQAYATITTPQGSYSMETSFGLGWIYKNPAEPELTNVGTDDFAVPKTHP